MPPNEVVEDPHTLIAVERHNIDEIDKTMALLLCRRYQHVKLIGEVKARHGLKVHDPNREATQIANLSDIAIRRGVPATVLLYPFRMIITASRLLQGEKSDARLVKKKCMQCRWGTFGIDAPDGSGLRVCPCCQMPLI